MPKKRRLSVRQIREIARLYFGDSKYSKRKVAQILKISKTTVSNIVIRLEENNLSWPFPADLDENKLEGAIHSPKATFSNEKMPDWTKVNDELAKKHVTIQVLWDEYRESFPDGLGRSQFYEHFRRYRKAELPPSMRMCHKGGDKLFVDYSGDGPEYIDRVTGETISLELFVCSWGASNFTYAEATRSQKIPDWIRSHANAFRYFKCVPHALVPDNLKSAVTRADYYDPDINPTYALMAEHYNTTALPARPRKPKDKASVESVVGYAQRYILARLRDRTFFSSSEVNQAISVHLGELNGAKMQVYKESRKERFERLDKPYAMPLNINDFPYSYVKRDILVGKDYHLNFNSHYYSVPYKFHGKRVEVRQVNTVIEIFYDFERIASHIISLQKYGFTTKKEHMPPNHQFIAGLSEESVLCMAADVGPQTVKAVSLILKNETHIDLRLRKALGIIRLEKKYTKNRLELAVERALFYGGIARKEIISILTKKLDEVPLPIKLPVDKTPPLSHENIRGANYYITERNNHVTGTNLV